MSICNRLQVIWKFFTCLTRVGNGNVRLVGICGELQKHEDWLWTFVNVQVVEPTKNTAKRAFRPSVFYRILSLGTQKRFGRSLPGSLLNRRPNDVSSGFRCLVEKRCKLAGGLWYSAWKRKHPTVGIYSYPNDKSIVENKQPSLSVLRYVEPSKTKLERCC